MPGLPGLLTGDLLTVRNLALLLASVTAPVALASLLDGPSDVLPGVIVLLCATALLALSIARSRARTGVQGNRGVVLR